MKKALLFLAVVLMSLSMMAQTTYTKISSESELNVGDKVLLVGYHENGTVWAMSYQKTSNRKAVEVALNGDQITTVVAEDPSNQTDPYEITVGGQSGAWTFFDELSNGYLYAPGGGNYLKTQSTLDNQGQWTLSVDGDGFAPTSNGGVEQNIMRYNPNATNNDPLFGCYKSSSNVTGLVYIFKASGDPNIYPEPSNYPTEFEAMVSGKSVILSWIDADGEQLPSKYLVLASTGAVEVPVDGVPVSNSNVAKNVSYGMMMAEFDNLNEGETYTFAIFPYTNSGANIDYKTDGAYPEATATVPSMNVLFYEDFATDLGRFTTYNVNGEQVWVWDQHNDNTYAYMNGYADGASHANEDWLISPDVTFEDGVYMQFKTAKNYQGDALRVMVAGDYAGGDPYAASWTDITYLFEFSGGNFNWVESGLREITSEIAGFGGAFRFAFVYTSTDEQSASWEVDDVTILTTVEAIDEYQAVRFDVYPNPANDVVRINVECDAMVQIMDLAGRMVMNVNVIAGENTINVEGLNSGVYFVKINGSAVKFVKK